VPAGERWIQEIKFEGCRVPLHLANETVLQNELKGKSTRIVMAAFDLLYLSGYDPRKLPPIERKTHLKKPIANTAVQFSESFEIDGPEMFTHACGIGLEGLSSMSRPSPGCTNAGPRRWVGRSDEQRLGRSELAPARLEAIGRVGVRGRSCSPGTTSSAQDRVRACRGASPSRRCAAENRLSSRPT
jgi:hypothetical protein